jgi:hypothetical protein
LGPEEQAAIVDVIKRAEEVDLTEQERVNRCDLIRNSFLFYFLTKGTTDTTSISVKKDFFTFSNHHSFFNDKQKIQSPSPGLSTVEINLSISKSSLFHRNSTVLRSGV